MFIILAVGFHKPGATDESIQLLDRYINGTDPSDQESALEQLLSTQAKPLIGRILSSKLHGDPHRDQDREDLIGDTLAQLLSQLRKLKQKTVTHSIQDFESYVASITYNAWNQYLRHAYPLRTRLRSRLRYLFTNHPDLNLWQEQSIWLCSHKNHQKKPKANPLLLGKVEVPAGQDLPQQVLSLLSQVQAPVPLHLCVDYFCDLYDVREIDVSADSVQLETNSPSIEIKLEKKDQLKWLYEEISDLSLNQRRALLLSLKDEAGGGMLPVLSVVGIASIRQLAELLDFEIQRFVSLWNDLPLDDMKTAEILGLTRQQVINLRKCARERLTRRMKNRVGI